MEKRITGTDVEYIASLARIRLTDQEVKSLTTDLEGILDYIRTLETLFADNIEPTSHVLPLQNVYRKDEVRPSLSQDEALQMTETKYKGAFKVPQVIE